MPDIFEQELDDLLNLKNNDAHYLILSFIILLQESLPVRC